MHDNKYQGRLAMAKLPLLQNSIIKLRIVTPRNIYYFQKTLWISMIWGDHYQVHWLFGDHWKYQWSVEAIDVMVLMDRLGLFYSVCITNKLQKLEDALVKQMSTWLIGLTGLIGLTMCKWLKCENCVKWVICIKCVNL